MPHYLGIDLGTTGLKAVLADEAGSIAGIGYREYSLDIPRTGYAEQDPERWHRAMCRAIADVLKHTGVPAADIRCVGLSGQMHGLVMLNGGNDVLCPAIIHCDGRAAIEKQEILARVGIEKMGRWVQNQVHSGFQALSLMWMRRNRPDLYAQMRHALLPKDYLRYRLTGEIATEPTDACSTLLYDCRNMHWSAELLEAVGVDASVLPDANHRPYEVAGTVTKRASEDTGLASGTPVAFGGGDQPMQAVGNGLLRPGSSSVNLGTSGQVFVAMDEPLYDPLLRTHTFCHAPKGTWYVMGAVLNACLAFNWFIDNVLKNKDFSGMDAEAGEVPPGARGLLFLPYLTGERTPHMSERARGAFIGLTLNHGRAEMVRAVLEGVAFSLRDALDVVRSLKPPVGHMVISGGGAKSELWKQIIADVFELPLYVSSMQEQAALGAILCAQVACGAYASLDEACAATVRYAPSPILPNARNSALYRESFDLYCEAYRHNIPLFERMW
ncbi:MAG: xylulokinase [Clostridiales bacterium]|nr:xylulokinase [Clostridiales bacterium]